MHNLLLYLVFLLLALVVVNVLLLRQVSRERRGRAPDDASRRKPRAIRPPS